MTSTALDALLADAAIPTASRGFDVAAGLRRLAAEAAMGAPTPEVVRAAQAAQSLDIMCRWVLNKPSAAAHVDRLVQDPPADEHHSTDRAAHYPPADERRSAVDKLDIEGAVVFACLLNLTHQPESAQFWWQLAAGANSRVAAYCLHLYHLGLGETREAQHWYHQVTQNIGDALDTAPDKEFLEGLGTVALYVRRNGSQASTPPTSSLEIEVDRLASRHPNGIVSLPDRRLADRLHDFTSRR